MTSSLSDKLVAGISSIVRKKEAAIEYGPIGIDLGPNGLRLVQFSKCAGVLALHASIFIPLSAELQDSSKKLKALLKKALKKGKFFGKEVVTCVQPQDTNIVMLHYTHNSGEHEEELIVKRMAERVDDDIENYVIDFMKVRPESKLAQDRTVLVGMAQRETVINYLEQLRKVGLNVKMLEIEPAAIRRLLSVKYGSKNNENLMAVSMGYTQTYITVLSGRRLIYERDVSFGEKQLIDMLCKDLELDEHEARSMLLKKKSNLSIDENQDGHQSSVTDALYTVLKPMFMLLLDDINRALVYAASETRGLPVKQIYLTSLVATWPGIETFIDSLTDVPVSVLKPFDGFENAQAFVADSDTRGAAVTGMALFGLTEVD